MSKDNGGPAFPTAPIENRNGDVQYGADGMSLRDYFAAKAMAEARWVPGDAEHNRAAAMHCYEIANAMLIARDETVEKIEEAG